MRLETMQNYSVALDSALSESKPFRARVSKVRGHQSLKIPIGDAVGPAIAGLLLCLRSFRYRNQPLSGRNAAVLLCRRLTLGGHSALAGHVASFDVQLHLVPVDKYRQARRLDIEASYSVATSFAAHIETIGLGDPCAGR
jgi:hypothetical protein